MKKTTNVNVTDYDVNDKVRLTEASLAIVHNSNRSTATAGYPSSDFIRKLSVYLGKEGVVTHRFRPGYEMTVQFEDCNNGRFHLKDNWVEPA